MERAGGRALPVIGNTDRVRHRVTQFLETVTAPFVSIDPDEVFACLVGPPALRDLFDSMPNAERWHGVLVCRRLRGEGVQSPDVLAAGLLHDVGKRVRPPRLWGRVAVVLLQHYVPGVARWIARLPVAFPFTLLPGRGLLEAFRVRRCHAEWGALLAARAGASPCTVFLIRRHHAAEDIGDADLIALQSADEA